MANWLKVSIRPGPRTDPERIKKVLTGMVGLNYNVNLDIIGGTKEERQIVGSMIRGLRSTQIRTAFVANHLE